MSPIRTRKLELAVAKLEALGLVPSAIHALATAGHEALYAELSRRGYVWSVGLNGWRKSKKPRKIPATVVKSGYLSEALFRFIVPLADADNAIAEFSSVMAQFGYEISRLSVHGGRNPDEGLIYCILRQNGVDHD